MKANKANKNAEQVASKSLLNKVDKAFATIALLTLCSVNAFAATSVDNDRSFDVTCSHYTEQETEQQALSRKEFNACKRQATYADSVKLSAFTSSMNTRSSCYQLELLMSEFHTESALHSLMNTAEMRAKIDFKTAKHEVTISRIKSHISHLRTKFTNFVKYEERECSTNKMLKEFRFVRIA